MTNVLEIEEGVYDIPLEVPKEPDHQQPAVHRDLINAQRRIRFFSRKYGLERHTREPFAVRAVIYRNQADFIRGLLDVTGMDSSAVKLLPKTVSAALECEILMAVSPDVYREIYPEGDEEFGYEKLIAHEMAHRLHIRILEGDEDAMGPVWFYEGFAVHAAGQFEDERIPVSEILRIMTVKERGSYRKYGAMMNYLLEFIALPEMIAAAGRSDFTSWVRSRMPGISC